MKIITILRAGVAERDTWSYFDDDIADKAFAALQRAWMDGEQFFQLPQDRNFYTVVIKLSNVDMISLTHKNDEAMAETVESEVFNIKRGKRIEEAIDERTRDDVGFRPRHER
jgi:cell division protein FtsB